MMAETQSSPRHHVPWLAHLILPKPALSGRNRGSEQSNSWPGSHLGWQEGIRAVSSTLPPLEEGTHACNSSLGSEAPPAKLLFSPSWGG